MKAKKIIKEFVPSVVWAYLRILYILRERNRSWGIISILKKVKVVRFSTKYSLEEDYVRQMNTIMSEIEIPLQDYYVYLYDPWLIRMIRPELEILSSITVDYEKILESDITKIKNSLNGSDNRFSSSVGILLDSIEKLGERVHYALSSSISGRHTGSLFL